MITKFGVLEDHLGGYRNVTGTYIRELISIYFAVEMMESADGVGHYRSQGKLQGCLLE